MALGLGTTFYAVKKNPAKFAKSAARSPMITGGALALVPVLATLGSTLAEQNPDADIDFDQEAINASVVVTGLGLLVNGLVTKHVLGDRTEVSTQRAVAISFTRNALILATPLITKGLKKLRTKKLTLPPKKVSKNVVSEEA